MPKAVAISGHRDVSPEDVRRIWAVMKVVVENKTIDEVWVGGARGTDDEALKAALHYRKGSRPKLVVVVPDVIAKQPRECWEAIHQADEVIELRNEITHDDGFASFQLRNEFMVDHAAALIAFWSGKRSGTGNAVAYAKKIQCPVRVIQVGS